MDKSKLKNDEKRKSDPASRIRTAIGGCLVGVIVGFIQYVLAIMFFALAFGLIPMIGVPDWAFNIVQFLLFAALYCGIAYPLIGFIWGITQYRFSYRNAYKFFAGVGLLLIKCL